MSVTSQVAEFVGQCLHNLRVLQANLTTLGYQFSAPSPLSEGGRTNQATIVELRATYSSLPAIVEEWYGRVNSVDFSQHPQQLNSEIDVAVAGLGLNPVLVFLDLPSCLAFKRDLIQEGVRLKSDDGTQEILPSGGVASNCTPKGFWLPDGSTDPVLYDEGFGPITFSQELSKAFAAGGFPFWAARSRKRRPSSPLRHGPRFLELLPRLVEGLVPVTPLSGGG